MRFYILNCYEDDVEDGKSALSDLGVKLPRSDSYHDLPLVLMASALKRGAVTPIS